MGLARREHRIDVGHEILPRHLRARSRFPREEVDRDNGLVVLAQASLQFRQFGGGLPGHGLARFGQCPDEAIVLIGQVEESAEFRVLRSIETGGAQKVRCATALADRRDQLAQHVFPFRTVRKQIDAVAQHRAAFPLQGAPEAHAGCRIPGG